MNIRPGLWVVSLSLFPLLANAAPAVADASKKLDTARTNVGKAVDRIKIDPPSNADLDAAAAAVDALKEAIDFGAELEQSDLDYARSALAARKELRTQREYVDQRRANIKIFDARRAIDAAVKPLADKVSALQGKDAPAKDFDDARAAADAVKKLADESRPFGKQDAAFAKYLGETDALVAKQLKAIDDRQVLLAVEKQRASLDEARQALKIALQPIGKEASDEQFNAGDKLAKELAKRLDDGKPLEPKNAGYLAEANKARGELTAAKKKMDDAWTATGLQRLKAEVEPAYKDLLAAGKPLKGKPTQDQLAEARTAAIVVRKLVEKFAAEAERSQAFGNYMTGVKKNLADVETEIEKRSLVAAQLDVLAAQRAVDKKAPPPTDEQFQELTSAIGVLEKTLASVHQQEPQMAKPVGEANFVLKGAKETAAKRRVEVDSDTEKKTLATAQADVQNAQKAVEKKAPQPTDDQFQELATAISVLEKSLGAVHKDEPLMTKAVGDAQAVLKGAKETAARRRREVDSENEAKSLATAQADVLSAQRTVEKKTPQPTDDQFQELATAISVLEKTLGSVHKDEPLMTKPVGEASYVLKGAKESAAKRRLEVDVERQKNKVEEARKIAAEAMTQMNAAVFGQEQIDSAEKAVKLIGTVLEPGAPLIEKDKGYAAYDKEVKTRIKELEGKIAARKIVFAANTAKQGLIDNLAATKAKLAAAQAPEGKDSDLEGAIASAEALNKSLEAQAGLEKQNPPYFAQAEKTRNALYGILDTIEMVKLQRQIRKQTGEQYAGGVAAADGAGNLDLRARKQAYVKAVSLFRACQSEGANTLAMFPMLAKTQVLADGKLMTPREVMAQCIARADATDQLMKDVTPLIKFEDGPKKSFEAGKNLLGKSKKNEALAQFNECIATGVILQHDNPELTDKEFTVAGANMTLGEVIKQCMSQKKAIAGK